MSAPEEIITALNVWEGVCELPAPPTDGLMRAGDELASRLRALLADVARLTEENHRLAEQIGELDGDLDVAEQERDEARATLAAVRKVAEEYDLKPNPCAAAIMGILEGKP